MKTHHYISALWAAVILLAASLTACADHDFNGQGGTGGNDSDPATMQIGLNVVLPAMPGSRATYEYGDAYENTVNIAGKDYRLMLFSVSSRTLLCDINPEKVKYRLSSSLPYTVCTITAEVDKEITTNKSVLLVMLANWGDYPDVRPGYTTIDDLAGYASGSVSSADPTTFLAADQLVANGRNSIPMFGIRECTNISWLAGTETWLGDVWLLRAVAKIEVRSADNLPPIKSVELSRYNTRGTCAPRGVYSQDDYVAGTDRYKPLDYVTIPGGDNDYGTKNYLLPVPDKDNGSFVVYVPEYQILSDYSKPDQPLANRPVLNVSFEGIPGSFPLEFKYYNEEAAGDSDAGKNDYFDIRRNYIYRFNVHLNGNGLEWNVDVLPYTSVELKPDFGMLLEDITLNKYVSKLFTDPSATTASEDVIVAYDEYNRQLSAEKVTWRYAVDSENHVCVLKANDDGTCTVTPVPHATGREAIQAVTYDKNGFEISIECIVDVSERHIGLEKAYVGLVPEDVFRKYSYTSFRVNIVAERDNESKISWELLDSDDNPLTSDLLGIVTVNGEGDGSIIPNGDVIGQDKVIYMTVQANSNSRYGTLHLWIHYEGPDPDNSGKRRTYSTYCDVEVAPVTLSTYPTILSLTKGRQASVTARTTPIFSDYIPAVSFESLNPAVATVDANGLVTAVGQGATKIKVTSPDELLSWLEPEFVDVTVAPDDLVLMRYDGSTPAEHIEMLSGEKISIRAFSHGEDISSSINWTIADESTSGCIEVKNGVVTAKSTAGTSTVKATYTAGGKSYSASCIVVVAKKRELFIEDFPKSVSSFASVRMKAYVFPDSVPYNKRDYKVEWSSNNSEVIAFHKTDPSLAVATGGGQATVTATTYYNGTGGQKISASAVINVVGQRLPFKLKIYDENGNYVTDIDSEYTYYPNTTDVGGDRLFDLIRIPNGKTWTARIELADENATVPASAWAKYQRYSYHFDRIILSPSADGMSCSIKMSVNDTITTRYNEVHLRFEYKGVSYSRAFCVYTQN